MNQIPMTFEKIQLMMGENPMLKAMIYTLIQNPMLMNQIMNIINVLNCDPLILNQVKNMMNQEMVQMMNNQMMQMMNNQMMQMMNTNNNKPIINQGNMETNFEVKEQDENPTINIIFRKQQGIPPLMVKCKKKDKVSDVINKYRLKSGDNDKNAKFIYNAKPLHPSLTIEEAGMTEGGNVFVINRTVV